MNRLIKTITTTKEIEIDIELPYYCKNICFMYKVISETEALKLSFTSSELGIEKTSYFTSVFNAHNEFQQITESEFTEKYNQIKSQL